MRPIASLLAVALCICGVRSAVAQPAHSDPRATEQREIPSAPARRLGISMAFGSSFDSNIDHNLLGEDASGTVIGTGLRWRDDVRRPSLEAEYEIAVHAYPGPSRWDRVSHHARAIWESELGGRWTFAAVGEMSLKGNSEDRDLSDQYLVEPRLEVDLASGQRLRFYGAYRLKRYEGEPLRDARNPMGGVEYRLRTAGGDRLELGARYDVNITEARRYRYRRWTVKAEYAWSLSASDALAVQLAARYQRYPYRLIDIDDEDFERRDWRWTPEIAWTHAVGPAVELRASYRYETRRSVDIDKGYDAHLVQLGLVRRW